MGALATMCHCRHAWLQVLRVKVPGLHAARCKQSRQCNGKASQLGSCMLQGQEEVLMEVAGKQWTRSCVCDHDSNALCFTLHVCRQCQQLLLPLQAG